MRKLLKTAYFRSFLTLERCGVHVLPSHYHSPVPNFAWLNANRAAWTGRASMTGLTWDLDRQLAWLCGICNGYYREVQGLGFYNDAVTRHWGPGYGAIESQVLHCLVRSTAPGRIVEIGSGLSTACMLRAMEANSKDGKQPTELTCIEPYPNSQFSALTEEVRHVKELCQTVSWTTFSDLKSGDLLFIDSSHAVKVGSDVIRIYVDIIPKLPAGVFIHIHDVFLPYLYPRDSLHGVFGWQETALLLALLTNNHRLSALTCLSALHYDRPKELASLLTDYQPQANDQGLCTQYPPEGHFPSSLWLRTQ